MAIRRAGRIVLCRFPQTDFAPGKRRPALLLLPLPSEYDDWLVCMMSTKIEQAISDVDELITVSDSDFAQSGLKEDTLIRLTRLATVTDLLFTGTIGQIGSERLTRLKSNLARWIEES